jgi:hypothetical protein
MDPAALALTVTNLLAPYLAKAGGAILDRATAGLPDAVSHLWDAVTKHFEGKPAAAGAATELAKNASDQDLQDAFQLQLKMALKNDPEFARGVQELVKQAGGDTITNTATVTGNGNSVVQNTGAGANISSNTNVKSG